MNRGEVWQSDTGALRLIVSPALYNASELRRVVSCQIGEPPATFEPYAVPTRWGTVFVDLIATTPRTWLSKPVGRIADEELSTVDRYLRFLVGQLSV
ncbi:MAG TPA: hypothetical protein VGJ63_04360 [Micromonosporaceae bacterium]